LNSATMPVALIIGVGAAVGTATAKKFAAAGYKVAVASRTQRLDPSKFPFFEFDAAEVTQVPGLFKKVHQEVGVPEVVIYNGMYLSASMEHLMVLFTPFVI
jgi:NAD(P)-dependent dehydrogenase (short-subunit alcohol dehydrogenase family)